MSVIVTGIDMSKSCGECNASGTGVCRKWFDVKEIGLKRSEHCPLKSVDGLIEKLNKAGANNDKSVFKNLHPSYVQGLRDAVKIIKEYCGMEDAE